MNRVGMTLCALLLSMGLACAQDDLAPDDTSAPAADPSLEQRVADLERKLAELDEDEGDDMIGMQISLRAGLFHLAHNRRDDILAGGSDSQYGWSLGAGIMATLWPKLGPIDLAANVHIEYRHLNYSPDYRSPLTGRDGTINYLNVAALPTIRLPLADGMFTPFVFLGPSIQVASPPKDAVTYIDLGFVLGLGFDVRLHERLSIGLDYKYTFLGVADQEDEDYGQISSYLGFNF